MNLEVGVLKDYARVDRIAPCDNIHQDLWPLKEVINVKHLVYADTGT